jgi:lysophospholipase L1-like esterase
MRAAFLCAFLCTNAFAYRMAAIGDSITSGVMAASDGASFNGDFFKDVLKWLVTNPAYNYATGTKLNSHCERLNYDFGNFECRNFAEPSTTIEEMYLYQLPKVIDYDPDYVTFFGGANDICRGTPLSPRMFYNIVSTVAYELQRNNRAVVLVGIPDITHLYDYRHNKGLLGLRCKTLWKITNNCPNITNGKNLNATRNIIAQYNNALKDIAKEYGYYFAEKSANMKFEVDLISKIDCFHPSYKAHQLLASDTYPFKGVFNE